MRFDNHRLRKLAVATLAVLAAVLVSSAILAQPGPQGHRHMHHKMMQHLDLTEEQQQQFEQILDRQRTQMQEQREQVRVARLALSDAVHATEFDEAAIRLAAADLAALEADQAVVRASMIQELHRILTPDQLEKARAHHERMRELHEEAGPGAGPGRGFGHGRMHGQGRQRGDCPCCGF